jgi:hypothetical protein
MRVVGGIRIRTVPAEPLDEPPDVGVAFGAGSLFKPSVLEERPASAEACP